MPVIDMSGKRFGKLFVLHKTTSKNGMMQWQCICDCGEEKEISGNHLRTGHTTSCGCVQREVASIMGKTTPRKLSDRKHERLYHIWKGMRKRCRGYEEHHKKYYASRDIIVCNEWNDYPKFKEWALNNGYSDNLTIDRIDNNGNYEPDNCRWITMFEQASNKRNNRWITVQGISHTLAQWARIIGKSPSNLHHALKQNGVKYLQNYIEICGYQDAE